MEGQGSFIKEFMPLVEKLIWPIFITILLIAFSGEAKEIYGILKNRLSAGASIKIGGFSELGEKANASEIGKLGFDNIRIEAMGGPAEAVSKESFEVLNKLREEIKASPNRRIETLRLDDSKIYSTIEPDFFLYTRLERAEAEWQPGVINRGCIHTL